MYTSFEARNFRCFQDLAITGLERVNLVAGLNNVGKTALLEALFIYGGAYNPELTLRLNAFRGIEQLQLALGEWVGTPWDSVFRDFDSNHIIELVGNHEIAGRRVLRLRVLRGQELARTGQFAETGPPWLNDSKPSETVPVASEAAQLLKLEYEGREQSGQYHMIFDKKGMRVDPIAPEPPHLTIFQSDQLNLPSRIMAKRFGALQTKLQKGIVLDVLSIVEPRLRGLEMVIGETGSWIAGDIGIGRLVPLPLMGGGVLRLASLVTNIGNAPNGVVLVDEIENGLHHSVMKSVWQAVADVARQFNTQVFATTHSHECIVAAHEAFSDSSQYDFRLHRLERMKGEIRALTYDQETLNAAIETNLEVR